MTLGKAGNEFICKRVIKYKKKHFTRLKNLTNNIQKKDFMICKKIKVIMKGKRYKYSKLPTVSGIRWRGDHDRPILWIIFVMAENEQKILLA